MMLSGLKKYRILAGLTQGELAERVGMHRDSMNEIENGKRPARSPNLEEACRHPWP